MALDLYHWEPTVNSGEVLIYLAEKQLAFTGHYVDVLAFEQHTREFLALNPRGELPVLVHDGAVFTETMLILEYLEAAFPPAAFVPEAPGERYRMRVWTKLAHDYFAPALTVLGWHLHMVPRMNEREGRTIEANLDALPRDRQTIWRMALDDAYTEDYLLRARQAIEVAVHRMAESLSGDDWLAGSQYSLADMAVFPSAYALAGLVPELPEQPRVKQWLQLMQKRPAVQAALAMGRSARPQEMFAPGPELSRWG